MGARAAMATFAPVRTAGASSGGGNGGAPTVTVTRAVRDERSAVCCAKICSAAPLGAFSPAPTFETPKTVQCQLVYN